MKISGFTFVRNALKYDYPIKECIETLSKLCDEVIVVVAESEDETLSYIKSIHSDKLKLINSKWDTNLRFNILSQQTNLAMDNCSGNWGIYLQSDEIIHERYFPIIKQAILDCEGSMDIEGLLFDYKHFYGSYRLYNTGRSFYRNEVRAIRLGIGIKSHNDAKGFRIRDRKLIVKKVDAEIYHYGWARDPEKMIAKTINFHRLWHSEKDLDKIIARQPGNYKMRKNFNLIIFEDTHPKILNNWLEKNKEWSESNYEVWLNSMSNLSILDCLLKLKAIIERKTWWIGYNKPYRMIIK